MYKTQSDYNIFGCELWFEEIVTVRFDFPSLIVPIALSNMIFSMYNIFLCLILL